MKEFANLVSVDWLKENLDHPNLIVLDASIPKVVGNASELNEKQIVNARFFDIKGKFSDTDALFPNTIPSEFQFEKAAQELGVNSDSFIVVYDDLGIYSSPRAWWLFKTFGHDNVAVLDGGLPEWLKHDFPSETKQTKTYTLGNFRAKFNTNNVAYFESLETISQNPNFQIIDARSSDRFNCIVAEPRKGLRSGQITNSQNLPYAQVLNDKKLKSVADLEPIFKSFARPNQHLVFSCGSGITASVLSLAATILGYNNSVYDGSWTEYGTLTSSTMEQPKEWTKDELLAYILIFVAHSDLDETKKEKEYILSRVDKKVYQRVHEKFDADNDYQSIQNIIEGVKTHDYYRNDLADLFADIKLMAFADGELDQMEDMSYKLLKKILK